MQLIFFLSLCTGIFKEHQRDIHLRPKARDTQNERQKASSCLYSKLERMYLLHSFQSHVIYLLYTQYFRLQKTEVLENNTFC